MTSRLSTLRTLAFDDNEQARRLTAWLRILAIILPLLSVLAMIALLEMGLGRVWLAQQVSNSFVLYDSADLAGKSFLQLRELDRNPPPNPYLVMIGGSVSMNAFSAPEAYQAYLSQNPGLNMTWVHLGRTGLTVAESLCLLRTLKPPADSIVFIQVNEYKLLDPQRGAATSPYYFANRRFFISYEPCKDIFAGANIGSGALGPYRSLISGLIRAKIKSHPLASLVSGEGSRNCSGDCARFRFSDYFLLPETSYLGRAAAGVAKRRDGEQERLESDLAQERREVLDEPTIAFNVSTLAKLIAEVEKAGATPVLLHMPERAPPPESPWSRRYRAEVSHLVQGGARFVDLRNDSEFEQSMYFDRMHFNALAQDAWNRRFLEIAKHVKETRVDPHHR